MYWHEETQGGVREVVVDGRYWAVWVYEERMPEREAMEAADRYVAGYLDGSVVPPPPDGDRV